MKQDYVLAELEEYARGTPAPHDSNSVLGTVAYLKACNSLFERGILGKHAFIKTMNSPISASMDEGYSFFGKWLDEHLTNGIYTPHCVVYYAGNANFSYLQVTQLPLLPNGLFYPGRLGTYFV